MSRNFRQRLLSSLCLIVVVAGLFAASARPADAFLFGPVQVVFDPKNNSYQIKTSLFSKLKDKLKKVTDIAFKNSSNLFLGRVVQEAAIQLATTRPGQKPLFLTNPQTFFRDVGNAAAGDFIDGFQRGITGGSLNSQGIAVGGQTFGRSQEELFSDAQQRFIISRILRKAAGDPVQSCQEQCRVSYAVRKTNVTDGTVNEYERNIAIVNVEIKKTQAVSDTEPTKSPFDCHNVYQPVCSVKYCPWEIKVSNSPVTYLDAKRCYNAQVEAVRTEYAKSAAVLKPCMTECRNGVAGATQAVVNNLTATDIFSANEELRQTPALVANSLSQSKSDVGRLLGAFGALTATVQERVIGEDTNLRAGVLPKTSPVSKKVQTPKEATSALFGVPFYNSAGQLTYTGTGAADILRGIASFLNSPIGRALTVYFKSKCGLNPDSCKGPSNPTSTFGQLLFGPGPSGVVGAQLQFATLARPELITGDPGRSEVSITDELTTSGLIDAQFRSAIDEQLTVREALAKNLLDPKKTFGFDQNGIEPRSGYPYRALQYLRKYRVIPVGWELAAKYSQSFGHRALSLGFLTEAFPICGQDNDHKICTGGAKPDQKCAVDLDCGIDPVTNVLGRCTASPYCGLVDPDWVLKAPQTYCRRQGAGEEIVSREFICDQNNIDKVKGTIIPPGTDCSTSTICTDVSAPNCTGTNADIGRWVIERNSETCADVQSCITENDDGTCQGYGYCVQERQTFKFNGTQCSPENASCTTYVDDNGEQVSYLASTLDFRKCNAENAGCEEYATGTCAVSGNFCATTADCGTAGGTCVGAGTIKFNGQVTSCSQIHAGCREYIRTLNGANLNTIYLGAKKQICQPEDVGCELYTPVAGGPNVTAVGRDINRCTSDNVGCATYTIEPITTLPQRPPDVVNVVAPRGRQCSAADVGCEEYTNLDQAALGGEALEYYKAIKQCVKPTPSGTDQVPYYTWVGDPDQGFVLRAYTLLKSNADNGPCTNTLSGSNGPTCNDVALGVVSCSQAELATNPDCAEYYDSALKVYYRLRSRTISVTNDCHPYRNTIDQATYYLSPNENLTCPATAASCRAYTGNAGKTKRQIFRDTFVATTADWTGGTISSASTTIAGHSMKISTTAFTNSKLTSGQFSAGKTYIVSFIAASAQLAPQPTVTAALGTVSGTSFSALLPFSGSATAKWNTLITPPGPEWNTYTLGPLTLTTDPAPDTRFGLITSGDVYVDNVTLTEINDSLYMVSTSVPICAPSEVGCAAYRDRQRQLQYFKSFTRICSEEVVGCEEMIDTQNSTITTVQTVKGVTTPADSIVYVVNNPRAFCPASAKGCSAFGQPKYLQDGVVSGYTPVYLKNDPDTHTRDLCLADELFCRAYTQPGGSAAFFKDPVTRTCEFRGSGTAAGQWYISGTSFLCPTITPPQAGRPVGASCAMTCDSGQRVGKGCVTSSDCVGGGKCTGDASSVGKITGGAFGQCTDDSNCLGGNKCIYLAGTCPDEQNGCNEYRDPSDPVNCRSECPLELQGGSPILMDGSCQVTRCVGGPTPGQNCADSTSCGTGGSCQGSGGTSAVGVPGCRSYFYLRQSIADQAGECNGQVNTAIGCRPFNDTSNPSLNFRGQ